MARNANSVSPNLSMQSFITARTTTAKIALMAGLFLLVGGGGAWGYRWYTQQREDQAHRVFSDCMYEYYKAQSNEKNIERAANAFKQGYEQHKHSVLAPYFLLFQADLLIKQQQLPAALPIMEQALQELSSKSAVYPLYQLKYALMRLDHEPSAQAGLEQLSKLAHDTANPYRDAALYHLALYYHTKGDSSNAQETFKQLTALPMADKQSQSPWAHKAAAFMPQVQA